MSTSLRPLHISKFIPPPYAGVEAHVDTVLRALLPEVEGTLLAGGCPDPTAKSREPVPYKVLSAKSFGKFASVTLSPGVLALAKRELATGRSNLLHIHAPNPWGDLAALACPADVPVVMTWHSDIVRQRNLLRAYAPIQRRALERVSKIIVFTPKHYESSAQLHQIDLSSKVEVVPIGLDFDRLRPKCSSSTLTRSIDYFAHGRPVILTVGRHVYYKGYEYLLSAMEKLKSEAVLVLVGTGVLTEELKKQADLLRIRHRVLFVGEVDETDLVGALHRCDVFCLPSVERSEAFGIASAEAMACGKPTVVCELGNGVNYLNRAGLTSIVVPPRDVLALANALDLLVRDDVLRRRMGDTASDWVRTQFGLSAMKLRLIALYQSLM